MINLRIKMKLKNKIAKQQIVKDYLFSFFLCDPFQQYNVYVSPDVCPLNFSSG